MKCRAKSVHVIVREIEASFADGDRAQRTEMLLADCDVDEIATWMETQQRARRRALRQCVVLGCAKPADVFPCNFFESH